MEHHTGTLRATDGVALFTRHWTPRTPPCAALVFAHGIHEHSGRHAYAASLLLRRGVATYALDHRGHGQSEGERGYVDRFAQYVDDLAAYVEHVRGEAGGVPVFLLGHSMGGLIAATYVAEHGPEDLAGLVLSSPALMLPTPVLLRRVAGLASRFTPRLRPSRVDLKYLSRDPAIARKFTEDPHNQAQAISARLGAEVLQASDLIQTRSEAFRLPLYLFHGTADRITDPRGSQWLYDHAPSQDKTLKLYDGLYHETMNEPERDEVIGDLGDWLEARV